MLFYLVFYLILIILYRKFSSVLNSKNTSGKTGIPTTDYKILPYLKLDNISEHIFMDWVSFHLYWSSIIHIYLFYYFIIDKL